MKKHLTEEEIQEFLDNKMMKNYAHIKLHLKECSQCSRLINDYQKLYGILKAEPKLYLPVDFTDRILSSLPAKELEDKFVFKFLYVFTILCSIVMTGWMIPHYFDISPYVAIITEMFSSIKEPMTTYLKELLPYFNFINERIALLGMIGFVLIIIALLDHFVFQAKHKKFSSLAF